MSTRILPPGVSFGLLLCLGSFALIATVLFAALVPVVDCPDGCLDRALPNPCEHCNGWGRSTALQHGYYLHYEWQKEKYGFTVCGTGIPRQRSLRERIFDRVVALFDDP